MIRVATLSDASLLAELAASLFEQTFGADNTPEDMADYLASNFTTERQAAELGERARVVFLAEVDGTAGGYASLKRDSRTESVVAEHPSEIERIYVDRSLHGRSVGAVLMGACVEQARQWGCDVLWLAVWEKNPRAIAFYEKSGFARVGVKDFVLGSDVQHDHVMARPLD